MFAPKFITRATLTLAALTLMGCNDNLTAPTDPEEVSHGLPDLSSLTPPPLPASFMGSSTTFPQGGSDMAPVSAGTMTPSFSTSSSSSLFTATSNGMDCGWHRQVRLQTPNMTSISGGLEATYFNALLYRYDGVKWVLWRTLGWHSGVSNRYGNQVIGYIASIYPYRWISGANGWQITESYVTFPSLPAGRYAVAEVYQWHNGAYTWQWSRRGQTQSTECYMS